MIDDNFKHAQLELLAMIDVIHQLEKDGIFNDEIYIKRN